MNGAVYISFFQGQLESVLEQVVQLAVQEISRTVGSSLNALLLETAVKEQENHRIRLQLQEPREAPCAGGERAGGGRTKAREQQQQQQQQQQRQHPPDRHGSGGPGTESGGATDTRRLEHKGRVVDQLKSVMEKVLDFAVSELTKIVEASYDDLLLEITKMEHERRHLEESLDRGEQAGGGRRHGSENDSVSPSGSEEAREEACEEKVSKKKKLEDPPPPRVQSKPQDWVPILDKVFGQKWTDDSWPAGESGRGSRESRPAQHKSTSAVIMEPSPYSPQQDPRWTPLEDMEVFSPDVENGHQNSRGRTISVAGPLPGSSGQRSSASMLQRLLTLPSQLLEEDSAKETLVSMAMDSSTGPGPAPPTLPADKELDEDGEEGEEGEEEERGKKRKRRRVWSECEDCGRRFSRVSQLKSHRLTHAGAASDWVPATPPGASGSSPLQCSDCGKRFSSATRLHSHMRTLHPGPEPD